MDSHVARGAVLVTRVRQVMRIVGRGDAGAESRSETSEISLAVVAFETDGQHGGARQQARVHGPVRLVADSAAFDAHRSVLEHERPALIDMAVEAGLFIRLRLAYHARPGRHLPGGLERAVGIMAIRTLHGALIHAMLEGHRELRPYLSMAAITKIGLLLREEKFGSGGFMDRVAA